MLSIPEVDFTALGALEQWIHVIWDLSTVLVQARSTSLTERDLLVPFATLLAKFGEGVVRLNHMFHQFGVPQGHLITSQP
jgi:hypothetical protein